MDACEAKVDLETVTYFPFLFSARWERAEAAELFDSGLVRPSRMTFEAADAAFADVTFGGATWESALPAAVLEALPVEGFVKTEEAFDAVFGPVVFLVM